MNGRTINCVPVSRNCTVWVATVSVTVVVRYPSRLPIMTWPRCLLTTSSLGLAMTVTSVTASRARMKNDASFEMNPMVSPPPGMAELKSVRNVAAGVLLGSVAPLIEPVLSDWIPGLEEDIDWKSIPARVLKSTPSALFSFRVARSSVASMSTCCGRMSSFDRIDATSRRFSS